MSLFSDPVSSKFLDALLPMQLKPMLCAIASLEAALKVVSPLPMASRSSAVPPNPSPHPPLASVVELVGRLAAAAPSLSRDDARLASVVALAGFRTLQGRWIGMASVENSHPLLVEYSSDCTPLLTTKTITGQAAGSTYRRRGKSAEEYFVQQYYMSWYDADGTLQRTAIFLPATLLVHGKSMPALLSCTIATDMFQYCNGQAAQIVIKHTVLDRGMSDGYVAALSGHQCNLEEQGTLDGEKADLGSDLFYWHSSVSCALHDAANSLKWALDPWTSPGPVLDHIFAAVAAYRHCSCSALGHLSKWLTSVIEPMPESVP